jgi:integrase
VTETSVDDRLRSIELQLQRITDLLSVTTAPVGTETFGEAANRWLAIHSCGESTKSNYRSLLNGPLATHLNRPLAEVANDRISMHKLCAECPYGGRLVRYILTSVCDMVVAEGTLASHRLAHMDLPTERNRRRKLIPATREQLQTIADSLPERLALSVFIMRGTGCRPGECLALRSEDFSDGWLTISRKWYEGKVGPLKARQVDESRATPIPNWLAPMVAEHIAKYGEGALFPGMRNEYYSQSEYRKFFKIAARKAGLPTDNPGNFANFSAHMLRHLWATALRAQRVPPEDACDWGGWRSMEIYLGTYAEPSPQAAIDGRKAMDQDWAEFTA